MKWSLDKHHELVKTGVLEDCRVELLNGQIVEMPPGRDLYPKRQVYARAGIQEYWVFNLVNQMLDPYRERAAVGKLGHDLAESKL